MKKDSQSFKNDLACNITLIVMIALTVVYLVFLTLNFFCVISLNTPKNFSFIVAYILAAVCLILFSLSFLTEKLTNLYIPKWFRILFYVAFFLFTNVYYFFGFYKTILGIIVFVAYLAFLINIISLSIYFNTQKDNKNKLKVDPKHLLVNVFFYSLAATSIFQFIVNLFKILVLKNYKFTNLTTYVIEFGTMLGVCILTIVAYAISLKKKKTFINACLIKVNNEKN